MNTQILIVAFLVPQVITAIALYKLSDVIKEPIKVEPIKVELVSPLKLKMTL